MSNNIFTNLFSPFKKAVVTTTSTLSKVVTSRPTAGIGILAVGAAGTTQALRMGLGTPQQILDSYNKLNAAQPATPPLEKLFSPLDLNRPIPSIFRSNDAMKPIF